jgi:hypothetical protein
MVQDDAHNCGGIYSLRMEIATGVGILSSARSTAWTWSRVAGDALDLATLMTGLGRRNRHSGALFFAIGTVVAVTLIDMCCAAKMQQKDERPPASV